MPTPSTGTVLEINGVRYARVTIGKGERPTYRLACQTKREAKARARFMAELAAILRRAGHKDRIDDAMKEAATATTAEHLEGLRVAVRRIASTPPKPKPQATGPTFIQFAEQWTSGKLAKDWPDHVHNRKDPQWIIGSFKKHIDSAILNAPMAGFTLAHAEAILRGLPSTMEPTTRRLLAANVHRVVSLAVYPAKILPSNPIPKGWLPRVPAGKALAYLYPSEDAALMGHKPIPLVWRMLWGVLAREGMRSEEAGAMTWGDVDTSVGAIRLDFNKTSSPRTWAMDPGVLAAMRKWREMVPHEDSDPVFPLDTLPHHAGILRRHLGLAGVTRSELFTTTKVRRKMRVHDLRATFVTLALAIGKTERWVRDRTGHKTSELDRYHRGARTAAELNLGWLAPLDFAIPEFRSEASTAHDASNDASKDPGCTEESRSPSTTQGSARAPLPRRSLADAQQKPPNPSLQCRLTWISDSTSLPHEGEFIMNS